MAPPATNFEKSVKRMRAWVKSLGPKTFTYEEFCQKWYDLVGSVDSELKELDHYALEDSSQNCFFRVHRHTNDMSGFGSGDIFATVGARTPDRFWLCPICLKHAQEGNFEQIVNPIARQAAEDAVNAVSNGADQHSSPEDYYSFSEGVVSEGRMSSTALVAFPTDPPGKRLCTFLRSLANNHSRVIVLGLPGRLAPGHLGELIKAQTPDLTKLDIVDMTSGGGLSDALEMMAARRLYKNGQAVQVFCSPDVARGFAQEIRDGSLDLDPTTITVTPQEIPMDDLQAITASFTGDDRKSMQSLLDPHVFSGDGLTRYKKNLLGGSDPGLFGSVESSPRESQMTRESRERPECSKCGGTDWNDIRMGLGDCCLKESPYRDPQFMADPDGYVGSKALSRIDSKAAQEWEALNGDTMDTRFTPSIGGTIDAQGGQADRSIWYGGSWYTLTVRGFENSDGKLLSTKISAPIISRRPYECLQREFLADIAPNRELAIQVLHDLLATRLADDGLDVGDYEYLGSGRNGSAYRAPDGLILKVTTDPAEAESGLRLTGLSTEYIHLVHGVTELSEQVWLLEQEGDLEKLPEDHSEELDIALEAVEAIGAGHYLREGDWDEMIAISLDCSDPSLMQDVVEILERFDIPGMCREVAELGLSADFHSGNIMLRGGCPVLTDLGTPGDAPGAVEESVMTNTERMIDPDMVEEMTDIFEPEMIEAPVRLLKSLSGNVKTGGGQATMRFPDCLFQVPNGWEEAKGTILDLAFEELQRQTKYPCVDPKYNASTYLEKFFHENRDVIDIVMQAPVGKRCLDAFRQAVLEKNLSADPPDYRDNFSYPEDYYAEGKINELIKDIGGEQGAMRILHQSVQLLQSKGVSLSGLHPLGQGQMGVAYRIGDGRVLKVSTDKEEVDTASTLVGKTLRHVVTYHDVFPLSEGVWGLITDECQPLSTDEEYGIMDVSEKIRDERVIDTVATKRWADVVAAVQASVQQDVAQDIGGDAVGSNPKLAKNVARVMADFLTKAKRYQFPQMVDELRQNGIHFADYKPENIMKKSGNYVIIDLSMSKSGNGALGEGNGPMTGPAGGLKGAGSSAWSGGVGTLAAPEDHVPKDNEEDSEHEFEQGVDWGFLGGRSR